MSLLTRLFVTASGVVGEVPDTGCEILNQCLLLCGGQVGTHLPLDTAYCRAGRMEVIVAGLGQRGRQLAAAGSGCGPGGEAAEYDVHRLAGDEGPARQFGVRQPGPGQLAWLDCGLRALDGTGLDPQDQMSFVLLLLNYVRGEAQIGFPALARVSEAGVFDPDQESGDGGDHVAFGIARILDSIDLLIRARA